MTVRRLKTYASVQGYVYQYYFVGQRAVPAAPGTEYVFDVTSDRQTTYPVSIILPEEVVTAWNQVHGRELSAPEQYAAVKLRLFRAMDDMEEPIRRACRLELHSDELHQALAALKIE